MVSLTTAAVLAASAVTASAAAAVSGPVAPGGLKVARQGADQSTLAITWRPAAGAARYTVSIFDGTSHRAYSVPADTTSYTFRGTGNCTRYRVVVTAVGSDGGTAASNAYLVSPLAPGGLRNLQLERSDSGTSARFAWDAPVATPGTQAASNYAVQIRSLATNQVLVQRNSADTSELLSGLEPARAYVATITPQNSWGSCTTTRALLNGPQPSATAGTGLERDAASPSRVTVRWGAPSWSGYGAVTAYQIGYRSPSMRTPVWQTVSSAARSHDLMLDPNVKWSVWVRAINGQAVGAVGKENSLERLGAPGTPAVDPSVKVSEDGQGQVHVAFTGPVGSNVTYPRMLVAISPTMGTAGFSESQEVFNRAGTFTFESVPCGVYTVTVTGRGGTASKELARTVINRCNVGEVSAGLWKLVYGKATIGANQVNMVHGNEARVVSTVQRNTQDMAFTTDARLVSGWGYGIWTRATLGTGAAVSGYSFQFDPGYANVNAGFGKALLLRVWQDGRECGTPLAKVKWPTGLDVNKANRVVVVAQGDSLYATIDGVRMFDVPSLTGALASSGCGMKAPTGTQVGFRTWSAQGQATFHNTTIN